MMTRTALLLAIAASALVLAPAAQAAPAPLTSALHTTITGFEDATRLGSATVRNGGDVNGDGRDDILLFERCTSTAWVVFGSANPGAIAVSSLGSRGLTITNIQRSPKGTCADAAPLGDTNGDGRDDIGFVAGSEVRVLYGRTTGATVDLANLGTGGLILRNETLNLSRLTRVGDVNGDGRDDIGLVGTQSGLRAAGVVFGRAAGGTVDPITPGSGVAIYDSRSGSAHTAVKHLIGIGDPNGDGREDLFAMGNAFAGPGYAASPDRILLGQGAGSIDLATNPGVTFASNNLGVFDAFTQGDPLGDLNGDGVLELPAGANRALLSSKTAPYFDATRALTVQASLSDLFGVRKGGRLDGDGLDDLIVNATFGPRSTTSHVFAAGGAFATYLVRGGTTGTVDVRLQAPRIENAPYALFGARFTGTGGQLVSVLGSGASSTTQITTIGPAPAADTTPPTLTSVGFTSPTLKSCTTAATCSGPAIQSILRYAVTEQVYLESEWRRGSTLVATTGGLVNAQAAPNVNPGTSFTFYSGLREGPCMYGQSCTIVSKLPVGTYTVTLRASDHAGNRAVPRTASVRIT